MKVNDILTRIVATDLNIRIYTVQTLNTVREITGQHSTTPNATVALGRTINAAALLSATLKPNSNQNLSVRFTGNGPIKEVNVQTDAKGNIRGYTANPQVDLTHNLQTVNFSKCIGAGFITVSKQLGLKEPYESSVPLYRGDIANDIAYYLSASEQVPSAVILGLTLGDNGEVTSSGGILIQTFPDTRDEVIEEVTKNIEAMETPLGEMLKGNYDILSVLMEILGNHSYNILESHVLRANCSCSWEKITSALHSINKDEIEDMIEKDKGAEIVCTFCTKKYVFSESDLQDIIEAN